MSDAESVQLKQAHRLLTSGRLDEEAASELVEAVAELRRDGLPMKVFPKGIPVPDHLVVHTVFGRDRFELLQRLLDHPRLEEIRIFPRGIVNPEVFSARLHLR